MEAATHADAGGMRYALALESNLEVSANLVLSELHLSAFQFRQRRKHLLGELESLSSSVCPDTNHFALQYAQRIIRVFPRLAAIMSPDGLGEDFDLIH
jgi:hypothetical protein